MVHKLQHVRKYPSRIDGQDSMRARSLQHSGDRHKTGSGLVVEHCKNEDSFRVNVLKPESSKKSRKATGMYTAETSRENKFYLFVYRDKPDRIYRQDKVGTGKNGLMPPVCILEFIDGEWFPCTVLRQAEIEALRSFKGSALLDPDALIAKRSVKKIGGSGQLHSNDKRKLAKHQEKLAKHKPKKRKVSAR